MPDLTLFIPFDRDRVVLVFEYGPYPSIPKGTRSALKIGNGRLSANTSEWDAAVYKESGNTLILEVTEFAANLMVCMHRVAKLVDLGLVIVLVTSSAGWAELQQSCSPG